jgi:membrane protease YdiL (CAAX protease family)
VCQTKARGGRAVYSDLVTPPVNREPLKRIALIAWALSVPLLIPLEQFALGGVLLAMSAAATWLTRDPTFQRRFAVLLGCVALLSVAPINTRTDTTHALELGFFFALVVIAPWFLLRGERLENGERVISYQVFPKRWSRLEIAYVFISAPLAFAGLSIYFALSPEVPFNWTLPSTPQDEPLLRLFAGINAVGIWDELFFINTVYAVLRSLYGFWWSNLAQAVLYVSVLGDMAFTGWGPVFVAILALTQGIMFERSRVLIYVLVVHLIVDYFLFQAIIAAHYPGFRAWWHP